MMLLRRRFATVYMVTGAIASALLAQQPEMVIPVRYTEAQNHSLRRTLELTGSVESRRASLVASEVEGVVEQLAAREGDRVKKGQPLVRLRQQNVAFRLEAVEGQLKEAEARQSLALASLDRSRGLFDEKIISQQQLDDAVSEYEAWAGRVAQLQADVKRLKDDLDRTTVRAPFSGIVVEEYAAEGEWMSEGGPVIELVDFQDLEVTVEVPESYFGGVTNGSSVGVQIGSLSELEVGGTIRAIVPRADSQSRTFPVKISLPNPEGKIGVGMLAQVSVPVGEPKATVIVPKDAVVSQGNERVVFRIDEDNVLERLSVRTGSSQGVWIAVEGDVKPGDRVVTRGNERVFSGQKVNAEELEYELP